MLRSNYFIRIGVAFSYYLDKRQNGEHDGDLHFSFNSRKIVKGHSNESGPKGIKTSQCDVFKRLTDAFFKA